MISLKGAGTGTTMKGPLFLLVILLLETLTVTKEDPDVSCQFNNSCILTCTFTVGDEVIIHWTQKTPAEFRVHSHYYDKDQLGHQDQRFRDRTSLFKDEISRGNASLLLTGVMVQDQGRYQCYTSTITGNEETFINLHVYAPVQKVNIQQVENNITCSSEDIYPEPELSWTSSPPSNMSLQKPAVQQTEQQLYTISSSLILSDSDTDLDYSCTISTPTSKRTATLMKPDVITASEAETTTISCSTSNYSLMNLIWRFNQSEIILTKSGAEDNYRASEGWRQHVESVSETGSLSLKDLSSDQTGSYTCELSDAEETHIKHTFLHVTDKKTGSAGHVGIVAVVVVLVCFVGLVFFLFKKGFFRRQNQQDQQDHREEEEEGEEEKGEEGHELKFLPKNADEEETNTSD